MQKAKEQQEKRAKVVKPNAVEKSKLSNYFTKIQNEATTSDTDSVNTPAEETKIKLNRSETDNQDKEEGRIMLIAKMSCQTLFGSGKN